MIKFILSTLFAIFSAISLACEITLPSSIVILGKSSDFHGAIKHQNCDGAVLQELNHIFTGVDGKITDSQLVQMLKTKDLHVKIHPHLIQVQQFNQIVREQLHLPSGVQLKSSEAINSPNFLSMAPGDRLEVQCVGCLYGSNQTLNVNITRFDGTQRSLIVRADFKKMVKAYRFMTFAPAFSDVSTEALKEEFVESIPHTDLVTNLNTLKFYKLNKPVKAGTILKQSDLNAISLVKAGFKTEVIIENELVRIKTHGVSRNNGTLGEFVEVFHPQKNKKYQGKVIDINKVLVEL